MSITVARMLPRCRAPKAPAAVSTYSAACDYACAVPATVLPGIPAENGARGPGTTGDEFVPLDSFHVHTLIEMSFDVPFFIPPACLGMMPRGCAVARGARM